ncbi:MAG: hypothetical protein HC846_07870 [Blastocatellia bacterium]|nr:hypothetical protein [Blastocatellia bacterium]
MANVFPKKIEANFNNQNRIDWMFVFIFWTFIGVFAVIQSYIHYYIHDSEFGGVLTWGRLFLEIIPGWYYWGLITPVVFKLGLRFPIERNRKLFSVVSFFICC